MKGNTVVNHSRNRLNLTAMVVLWVLCARWGIQQVSIKTVLQGISPLMQSELRCIGAALLLALACVGFGIYLVSRPSAPRIDRR